MAESKESYLEEEMRPQHLEKVSSMLPMMTPSFPIILLIEDIVLYDDDNAVASSLKGRSSILSTQVSRNRKRNLLINATITSLVACTLAFSGWGLHMILGSTIDQGVFFPLNNYGWSKHKMMVILYIGFISRPLGAIFFGNLGDVRGRVPVLAMTVCLAGTSAVLIGFLPGFHTWHMWSTISLLFLRTLQGLGTGGTYAGIVLIPYEYCSRDRHRGFYAAIPQAGRALGYTLTIGLLSSFNYQEVFTQGSIPGDNTNLAAMDQGWRLIHLVSLGMIVTGIHLLYTVPETPEFERVKREGDMLRLPFLHAWGNQFWNCIFAIFALIMDGFIQGTIIGAGGSSFLRIKTLPTHDVISSLCLACFVQAIFTLVGGWESDRIGRRRLYCYMCLVIALSTPFFFHAVFVASHHSRIWLFCTAVTIYFGVIYGLLQGAFPALLVELFPPNVRYSGVSIIYQGSKFISSFMWHFLNTRLIKAGQGSRITYFKFQGHNLIYLVIYITILSILSAASVLMIQVYVRAVPRFGSGRSKVIDCVALHGRGLSYTSNNSVIRSNSQKSHTSLHRSGSAAEALSLGEEGEIRWEEGEERSSSNDDHHDDDDDDSSSSQGSSFSGFSDDDDEEEEEGRSSSGSLFEGMDEEEGGRRLVMFHRSSTASSSSYQSDPGRRGPGGASSSSHSPIATAAALPSTPVAGSSTQQGRIKGEKQQQQLQQQEQQPQSPPPARVASTSQKRPPRPTSLILEHNSDNNNSQEPGAAHLPSQHHHVKFLSR